jgi:hypothetical protein
MGIALGQRKKKLRKTAELQVQLKKRKGDILNDVSHPTKRLKQQSECIELSNTANLFKHIFLCY